MAGVSLPSSNYLRRLWGQGDQFARVFAEKRVFEQPNLYTNTDMGSLGFFETVFVRQ